MAAVLINKNKKYQRTQMTVLHASAFAVSEAMGQQGT